MSIIMRAVEGKRVRGVWRYDVGGRWACLAWADPSVRLNLAKLPLTSCRLNPKDELQLGSFPLDGRWCGGCAATISATSGKAPHG
jgi:hypothetical protein